MNVVTLQWRWYCSADMSTEVLYFLWGGRFDELCDPPFPALKDIQHAGGRYHVLALIPMRAYNVAPALKDIQHAGGQ